MFLTILLKICPTFCCFTMSKWLLRERVIKTTKLSWRRGGGAFRSVILAFYTMSIQSFIILLEMLFFELRTDCTAIGKPPVHSVPHGSHFCSQNRWRIRKLIITVVYRSQKENLSHLPDGSKSKFQLPSRHREAFDLQPRWLFDTKSPPKKHAMKKKKCATRSLVSICCVFETWQRGGGRLLNFSLWKSGCPPTFTMWNAGQVAAAKWGWCADLHCHVCIPPWRTRHSHLSISMQRS